MSADKEFYDRGVEVDDIAPFAQDVKAYFTSWRDEMARLFAGRTNVRVLELGAGSCATSFLMSQEPWVGEIVAADISRARMEMMAPHVRAMLGGDPDKVSFVEADFNEPLAFPDADFDLVVMDAALHHSRDIWFTLKEIRRVLKPGGRFVAQREHYIAPLSAGYALDKLGKSEEVLSGVSENAYLREQYKYYLQANGFSPKFKPVLPGAKYKALFFLNGLVFAKYNIISAA